MKRTITHLILTCLLAFAFAGCTHVKGSRTANGVLTIDASSFMTSVDGMQFAVTDANGFTTTLDLQKAGMDNQALTTVTGGLLKMAELGATFAVKAPTNSAPNTNVPSAKP